jgi:hypothetical protein
VSTPLSSCRGAIDLVDDNRVYLAGDYAWLCLQSDAPYLCDAPTGKRTCSRRLCTPPGCWPAAVAISFLSGRPMSAGSSYSGDLEARALTRKIAAAAGGRTSPPQKTEQ